MSTVNPGISHADATLESPRISAFFFWLFMMIALLLFLDPFNPGVNTINGNLRLPRELGPIKYIGLVFGWFALMLSLAGLGLGVPGTFARFGAAFRRSWTVLILALLILGGSLTARTVFDIKETYLPAACGMTAFFIGLAYICEARDPVKTVQAFFTLLLGASPFMIWHIVDRWIHGGHAFHEEIFMFVPLALYCFFLSEKRWLGWFWVFVFTVIGIMSFKNTSFLVVLMVWGYLLAYQIKRKFLREDNDSLLRIAVGYACVLLLIAAVLGLVLAVIQYQQYLPSGSTSVRMYLYKAVWERFLESPIYGSMFTGTTGVDFSLFPILGGHQVVTHSDFLDILSGGGVIAFVIFLGAISTVFRQSKLDDEANPRLQACMHGLRGIVLGGFIVMLFNPVMLNLPLNTMLWLCAGFLVGLAARQRAQPIPDAK